MYHDALHMRYEIACLASAWLAYAFLARVLRTARARLDRVLGKMGQASLRSYKWGSISGVNWYCTIPVGAHLSPGRTAAAARRTADVNSRTFSLIGNVLAAWMPASITFMTRPSRVRIKSWVSNKEWVR